MNTSKLTFRLQEIPDGESNRTIALGSAELDFNDEVSLEKATVDINFYKTDHFIQVKFNVDADLNLICDRTLRPFVYNTEGSYHILFEPNPVEESETDEGAIKQIPTDDLVVSIDKEVRDTILLNLPIRKIHPDLLDSDGKPKKFETQSFGPQPDEEELIDPRWEELKKLK
ncbi:MAG: DUF177 domain-containing protein [Rhodohalobacter sp.]|uniref:YceD family protein n=1 Tax=Rhodohalobacter sp. TaxID=1974210 RepID=UPI003976E9E5